jgi:predicted GNAT family N-acyltransferase
VYDQAGYTPVGGEFLEEGIEHVAMEKCLAGEGSGA